MTHFRILALGAFMIGGVFALCGSTSGELTVDLDKVTCRACWELSR